MDMLDILYSKESYTLIIIKDQLAGSSVINEGRIRFLTFIGSRFFMYSYNESQRDALFLIFI